MALRNEYISKSKPVLPNAKEIIALCHEKGCGYNGFAYPSNGPIAYIKYGYTVTVGEMQTQRYVYNEFRQMTNASGSGVKVPEIYHAFECEFDGEFDGEYQTYIVMEYVHGKTVGACLRDSSGEARNWVYDQVAKAIKQLLRVPVPTSSGSRPGPVGGGCIQHYFFRDKVAPKEYNSVGDLQNHINRVCYWNRFYFFMCRPHHHHHNTYELCETGAQAGEIKGKSQLL